MIHLRQATAADLPALSHIYAHAVRTLGPQQYDAAQVAAWAAFAEAEGFRRFILDATTFVAEADGVVVGFAGLADDGHVTALYVHGDYGRQGIGSALMAAVLARARAMGVERLYVEASTFSRPVFETFGFVQYAVEHVVRDGVPFERYLMRRSKGEGRRSK